MSEFDLIWRKYGLKDNPYFHYPLTVEEDKIPLSAFVGREDEKKEIKRVFEIGGDVRFMVVGEPGVGKTSLVNYVRWQASLNRFFTPQREIEINRLMNGNEFIILTISSIYSEIKRMNLDIDKVLLNKLEALFELTKYGELSVEIANLVQINRQKLIELFNEVVEAIIHPRFYGLIIHYDNLDNIDDFEGLVDMISDIRDFLFHKKVIFIFVGDNFLPQIILSKKRVSQIFLSPSLEVQTFDYMDVIKILKQRLEYFKIPNSIVTPPHTDEAVKILFEIHKGNIRDILNSLTTCIISLPQINTPIQITKEVLKETLYKKVEEKIISRLSPKDKEILYLIWKKECITPTEIAKKTGQRIQNISSYYLNRLKMVGAISERGKEGRNVYYEVTPIVKWLNLKKTNEEIIEEKKELKKKIQKLIDDFSS